MRRRDGQRGQALVAALVTMALLFSIAGGLAIVVSSTLSAQGSSTSTYLRDAAATSATAAIIANLDGGGGAGCPTGTVFGDISSYSCNQVDLVAPGEAASIALQWSGTCATASLPPALTGHLTAWLNARQPLSAVYVDGSASGCSPPAGSCVAVSRTSGPATFYRINDCTTPGTPTLHVVGPAGSVHAIRAAGLAAFVSSQTLPSAPAYGPIVTARLHGATAPLDLAALTSTGYLDVYAGAGNGTFQTPPARYFIGGGLTALTVGDFGDPGLDIAVTYGTGWLTLLHNTNGSFTSASSYFLGLVRPVAVAAGHFKEDANLDLAVATVGASGAYGVSILLGQGGGSFTQPNSCIVNEPDIPTAIAAGDFAPSDGEELAVATTEPEGGDVTLFKVTGAGPAGDSGNCSGPGNVKLAQLGQTSLSDHPVTMTTGQFDGSGLSGLGLALSTGAEVLLSNSDGTFTEGPRYGVLGSPTAIAAADFGFGAPTDLAVTHRNPDGVTVLLGQGNGAFQPLPGGDLTAPLSAPWGVAAGDFDGSGAAGLAVANRGDGTVSIFVRNRSHVFSVVTGAPDNSAYAGAYNEADLLWASPSQGSLPANSLLFEGGL